MHDDVPPKPEQSPGQKSTEPTSQPGSRTDGISRRAVIGTSATLAGVAGTGLGGLARSAFAQATANWVADSARHSNSDDGGGRRTFERSAGRRP